MYIIKINADLYYTGLLMLPITGSLYRAKHYTIRKHAQYDAIKIFSSHRYINKVEIVGINKGIGRT
ncbi:hypothetical protein [Pectinatus frisingensis]|uniref:hypothetical protein n=1 Tax=Pectinatus frisingensis TaxID=865 RepID=UPI0018C57183|nr:hypothetical protein [Pectinatus frisingensis]